MSGPLLASDQITTKTQDPGRPLATLRLRVYNDDEGAELEGRCRGEEGMEDKTEGSRIRLRLPR